MHLVWASASTVKLGLLTIFHNEIHGKVLDEEVAVVPQRLTVKRVEQRMARPVSHCTAAMCLIAYRRNAKEMGGKSLGGNETERSGEKKQGEEKEAEGEGEE